MNSLGTYDIPRELASELERKFFWWEPVGTQPRSDARIVAQAMDLASFDDVRWLEGTIGPFRLADAMLAAEPRNEILKSVRAPTLVLHGADDPLSLSITEGTRPSAYRARSS